MADNAVQFELVSPEKLLLSEEVEMVVVPGAEGDFGVLPGHTPVIRRMKLTIIFEMWTTNGIILFNLIYTLESIKFVYTI